MLLIIALIVICYLMAADQRRSVADYGLVADRNWARHGVGGLAAGVVFYAAYCAAAAGLGVFAFTTESISATTAGKAFIACLGAIPIAVIHQIIFSGYLTSTARRWWGWLAAIGGPALLFGVLSAETIEGLLDGSKAGFAVGMFAIAALLATLRLRLGSLAFPAGLLAGCIMVRRVTRKLGLLEFDATADWSPWLAPGGDPRQAPVMIALLCVGLGAAVAWLWRKGEHQRAADQPALDASFKKIVPFSNVFSMAPLDLWLPKLWQARFRVGLIYVPRLCVTLIMSTINTVLTLPERLLAPLLIRHQVPDPVFIVGVHRSGTTHLHNLLALDPRFCTPRNYQVFNPHGFLTGWLTTLVLGPFLNWRRPMDAMQFTAFSPQEEEFGIAMMTPHNPYWGVTLPRLFAQHEHTIYPEQMSQRERSSWQRAYVHFLRKVTFWSRRSPLLKSPYNTARVAALAEMFPRAKFIHITRHPYATYRSNMHLAEHGFTIFQLQDPDESHSFASRFLTNYRQQADAFTQASARLFGDAVAEVRFEDLEADPIKAVKRIYAALGWKVSDEYRRRLEAYLTTIADYKKNRFADLPSETRAQIDAAMGKYLTRWGYQSEPPTRKAA